MAPLEMMMLKSLELQEENKEKLLMLMKVMELFIPSWTQIKILPCQHTIQIYSSILLTSHSPIEWWLASIIVAISINLLTPSLSTPISPMLLKISMLSTTLSIVCHINLASISKFFNNNFEKENDLIQFSILNCFQILLRIWFGKKFWLK